MNKINKKSKQNKKKDVIAHIGSYGADIPYFLILLGITYIQIFNKNIFQIYISVNSGARIGVAEEVKSEFKVAWLDSERPERGFKYLYLSPEAFSRLGPLNSVKTQLIDDEGEARYKITDIIGKRVNH